MKERLKIWKEVFLREWTPSEKILLLVDVLLAGVLLGWLTTPLRGHAPVRNGDEEEYEDVETFEEEEDE